jgi:hypothetical protein
MSLIETFDYYYFTFFLLVSYGVFHLYKPVKIALDNNEKFKTYDRAKRYYIIKNFIKSALMAIIFIAMAFVFIPNILRGEWNDSHNRLIGVFYVSNDLAGLFAVPKLPQSTKFHHYTTVFLFMLICSISTEEETIGRLLVIYTIFSCIPFLVNTYLGLRFFYTRGDELTDKEKEVNRIIDINRILAYYVYLICCFFNWSYHIYFLIKKIQVNELTWEYYVYYLLLVPLINDDLILLSWLKNNKLDL